ncbi:MAG: DUF3142 domain-containing protein [Ignavibacteriae bacterium]|nr:DUF3142 domain-containing protein [Ignavibacteriota bacterium]
MIHPNDGGQVGKTNAHYRILGKLGEGGMLLTSIGGLWLPIWFCYVFVSCSNPREQIVGNPERMTRIPKLVLWAWERPEDLRFINSQQVGVAFLAKTIVLRGRQVIERPRLQPLRVNPGTPLIGVIRFESSMDEPSTLDSNVCEETVASVLQVASMKGLHAIQIDFDARVSERSFYSRVVRIVRHKLPDTLGLSITALTSWCFGDRWLESLPVDEAVPMLFRMGADHHSIVQRLSAGETFEPAVCKGSLGISMDEFPRSLPHGRRTYVFNPLPWHLDTYTHLIEKLRLQ